jgi:hypothetical protein
MPETSMNTPRPRAAIADDALWRPGWTEGEARDPDMLWLDKNENADPELTTLVASVVAEISAQASHIYP